MTDTERLQHIAAIAHLGGVDRISTEDALIMIRQLTLPDLTKMSFVGSKPAVDSAVDYVVAACRAARKLGYSK